MEETAKTALEIFAKNAMTSISIALMLWVGVSINRNSERLTRLEETVVWVKATTMERISRCESDIRMYHMVPKAK